MDASTRTSCLHIGYWSVQNQLAITSSFFIIIFAATVALDRDASRDVIECPGDIISYNCSIQSNSEAVHLTWHVTLFGETLINITYPNAISNISNENSYITTSLSGYRNEEFIHSTLEVTVQLHIPTDQIMLECSIDDIGNRTVLVYVNSSSK